MPGYEILESAQQLGRMLAILLANATELQRYFDSLNDPADPSRLLELWSMDNRDAFDDHLSEVERLLFNFLAACYSRVEFYRMLVNKSLIEGKLRIDYDQRVGEFASRPLHRWLFAVRRLMQHHSLPVSSGELAMGSNMAMRTTLKLDLEHLRQQYPREFRGAAREYMQGRDEQDVLDAVAEYGTLVKEFDTWFGDAYIREHLDEVEAFIHARNEAGEAAKKRRSRDAR